MTTSLRRLLEDRAARAPDAVAARDEQRVTTWADLLDAARRVAAGLVRDGVRVQERVVYVGKNDARYLEVVFGCALARAVPTPLNWRLAPAELATTIADAGARIAFLDAELADPVAGALGDLPDPVALVAIGEHDELPDLRAWRGPAEDPGRAPEPDDVAFQLYTSGTTGRPKGAMFANGTNVRALLEDIAPAWGFREGDVSLVCMPLFHMGGLAWALAGMARGAEAVVVRDFVPDRVLDAMDEHAVTMAFCVPAMLAPLVAAPGIEDRCHALRQMVYSGSPIGLGALERARAALGCDLVQIYGMTEATGAFAQLPADEHEGDALRSAGRPYPWVEVRLVDPGTLEDVAVGEIGEIWTRSRQNMVGYWHRPEETAETLRPDGWLRTGDLGRADDTGRLFLVDRAKDLVITGGENVYPAEVELVLGEHPDLAEVAVIGVPDERWGETVKAIAAPKPGVDLDPDAVIAYARERLARFKCPTSVELVEALPRTATGKVMKPQLREPWWRGHDRRIH